MSKWPELTPPNTGNWWLKIWNFGLEGIPYPRLPGESRSQWWDRIYPELCETFFEIGPSGEDTAAYLYGYTVLNVIVRAAVLNCVIVAIEIIGAIVF